MAITSVLVCVLTIPFPLPGPSFNRIWGKNFSRSGFCTWTSTFHAPNDGIEVELVEELENPRWSDVGSIDKVDGGWQNYVADGTWEVRWGFERNGTLEIVAIRKPLWHTIASLFRRPAA